MSKPHPVGLGESTVPPDLGPHNPDPADDVTARRARLKKVASLGQRTGYGMYVASLAGGLIGIRWGYTPLLTTLIAVALVVGSLLLLPAIVLSYGIRAAEREERQARQQAAAAQNPPSDSR